MCKSLHVSWRRSHTRMSTLCLFLRSPDSFSWCPAAERVLYTAAMAMSVSLPWRMSTWAQQVENLRDAKLLAGVF